MKMPQFLAPKHISGIGPRYAMHPGPYALGGAPGQTDLAKILPRLDEIIIRPLIAPDVKIELVTKIAACLSPSVVLEIGTFRGRTTHALANNLPEDARIITIDLPLEDRALGPNDGYYTTDAQYFIHSSKVGEIFIGTQVAHKITQIFSDCTTKDCCTRLDNVLAGRAIEFAFIDGGYSYEAVKASFQTLVLPRLAQGGIVIFNEYSQLASHVGVTHYLLRAAHDNGYLFYSHLPVKEDDAHIALFLNLPECRERNWRDGGIKELHAP